MEETKKESKILETVNAIINSKYAPLLIVVGGIVAAFAIYEYFETAQKGMELGYEANLKSNQFGEIQFTKVNPMPAAQPENAPNVTEVQEAKNGNE